MGLKVTALCLALAAAFMLAYANASTVASYNSGLSVNEGSSAPGSSSSATNLLRSVTLAGTSASDSFQFASTPGRWVNEFAPLSEAERAHFQPVPLQPRHTGTGDPGIVASSRTARDIRPAVHSVVAGERANPFFNLRTSDFVTTASYASSEPLTLVDIGSRNTGGAIVINTAGPAFMEAKPAPFRSASHRQPNAYAMLLAGLGLIGLMTRQRMSQD